MCFPISNMSSKTLLLIAIFLIVDYPVNQAHPTVTTKRYQWPKTCEGKSYCDEIPDYYPTKDVEAIMENVAMEYRFGNMQDRGGQGVDVGSCGINHAMKQIYLIKDKNDTIRFVPQTKKFKIHIAVEECNHTGKVKRAEYLSKWSLNENEVDCMQTMVPFVFPVLSCDLKSLDTAAPKDGISLGCSAKVLNHAIPPSKAYIMYLPDMESA